MHQGSWCDKDGCPGDCFPCERMDTVKRAPIMRQTPLAKCDCCQTKFYSEHSINRAMNEGCPGCGELNTVEGVR
jgi:hypothetical protein